MSFDMEVVVLTFNNENTIGDCLKAIEEQDYPRSKYNVIVFDNGSSDKTLSIVNNYNLKYYLYPGLNIAQLRNKALEHVVAPFVGLIDSDCVVDKDWISTALHWFVDEKIAVVGYKYALPTDSSYFERNWYSMRGNEVKYNELIPAGNMIIRKAILKELSGFNEELLTGEDADLLIRVREKGYVTVSDPHIKNIHLGNPKNIRDFYLKELWYALGTDWRKALVNVDKPFLFSLTFVSLLLLSLVMLLFDARKTLWPLIGILTIAFIAAIDRKKNKRVDGDIFYMTLVYIVYFCARASALVYIFKLIKYKKSSYLATRDGVTRVK